MTGIGIIVGESKPYEVMLEGIRPVSAGEYVILDDANGKILGLIERSATLSNALGKNIRNYIEALESQTVANANTRDKSYRAWVRILGYLDQLKRGRSIIPDVPSLPGTNVLEATRDDLGIIFAPADDEWVRIGSLLRNNKIEARVDMDKIVSRHLAILAMTGMGKSNLVSLLVKNIARIEGTMVIFDYHDDYSALDVKGINVMDAKINPRLLNSEKFAEVIEIRESATNQMHVLHKAFTGEVKAKQGDNFWDCLIANVRVYANEKSYRDAAERVEDKIDDARRRFKGILDPDLSDPTALIKNGKVNVLSLIELTDRQADIAVRFYLEQLLDDRKRATRAKKGGRESSSAVKFPAPVLVVIEEAHVFIPKDEKTETKYFAAKVAREGRKFGLGLVIVSQRPRSIDGNVLSQMGSVAIMKMVQQDDQVQVSAASEAISRDIIEQLPSLNPGDAVLVGQWVNLPAFVHIDEVMEKKIGSDQHAVREWKQIGKIREAVKESTQAMIKKGYLKD